MLGISILLFQSFFAVLLRLHIEKFSSMNSVSVFFYKLVPYLLVYSPTLEYNLTFFKSPVFGVFLEQNPIFWSKSPLFEGFFELNLTQKPILKNITPWLYSSGYGIHRYLHFPEEEISFDEFVSNTSIVVFHILPAVLPLKIEESTSKDCLVDFDIADAIHNSRVDAA